ncbi:hypothetical protein COO60DRAFT_533288 [Scenedesmus sp. NREL 46B-D3]|nr:hypothetical protein COO60DRAFT_533288 [Scenedesmus sp. NREL 46B-D3]
MQKVMAQAGKAHLTEDDINDRHQIIQFFAEGVNLLLDRTLLRGSSLQELDELVDALHAARAHFHNAPPGLFKAYVRSSERLAAPQLAQRFRAWDEAGVVKDLPLDYQSTKKDHEALVVIRDAVKAIHITNIREFPLRYMVVVVADTGPGGPLSCEELEHSVAVLSTASQHRTILAATRSQAIQLWSRCKNDEMVRGVVCAVCGLACSTGRI